MAFPSSYSAFFPKAAATRPDGTGSHSMGEGAAGPISIHHQRQRQGHTGSGDGDSLTEYPLFSSRRSASGMSPPLPATTGTSALGQGHAQTQVPTHSQLTHAQSVAGNRQPACGQSLLRRPSFLASLGSPRQGGEHHNHEQEEHEDERSRERLRPDSENGEHDDEEIAHAGGSGSDSPSRRQRRLLDGRRDQSGQWADAMADDTDADADADVDVDMDMMDDDSNPATRQQQQRQQACGLLSGSGSIPLTRHAQAPTSHLSRISSHLPLQMRARSLSQSTSMSGTTYSPPWPNSPPRSGSVASTGSMLYPQQHLQLARMTSEQNQAIQASATSANSAMFMVPTPYRNHQGDSDLLVSNGYEEAIDEDDEELSDGGDADRQHQPALGSFNPLNPTQLRSTPSSSTMGRTSSAGGMTEGMHADPAGHSSSLSTRPSSRSSTSQQDLMHSVGNSSASQSQPSEYKAGTPMERSASVESYAAGLRSARSSPALSAMGGASATANYSGSAKPSSGDSAAPANPTVPSTPPPVHAALYGSGRFGTTGDDAPPPTVPVPFAQQPLRRSQSASHRLRGFSHFATLTTQAQGQGRGSGASAAQKASDSTAPNVPHTAPVDGSFRVMRANSFSSLSNFAARAARQPPASGLGPGSGLGGMDEDSEGPAAVGGFGGYGFGAGTGTGNKGKERPSSASSGSDSTHITGYPVASSSGPSTGPGKQQQQQQQAGQSQSRVVKRAVNHKKGSLMPKSKDHLRTLTQLKMESGEFEIASEAALHRLSQSTPAMPPFSTPRQRGLGGALTSSSSGSAQASAAGLASHALSTSPFGHTLSPHASPGGAAQPMDGGYAHARHHRPSSSSGQRPIIPFPTKNRFPESAVVDDEDGAEADSSGSDDADYAAAGASGNEAGADTDDANSTAGMDSRAWALRDPALHRRDRPGMDMDLSPSSTLGWATASSSARPGKRKMTDTDRFEVYNSAFKRRAVSPGSTSSVSLSPLLTNANLREVPALPPGGGLSALGPAAQIPQSPSIAPGTAIQGSSWFYPGSRSRASSPAPSMSSSAGTTRRWGGPMTDEERERNKVDLGKMSLG